MKTLFKLSAFVGLMLLAESLMAQTTINPDSVCLGSSAETYWVTNNPNSSYQWSVDPTTGGAIVSGQGTNSIVIDWSATSIGLYTDAITLVETDNSTTCSGQVTIDVEVIPIPANLQAVSVTACEGGAIPDLFTLGGIPSSQFEWYSDPALTNFLGTGPTYATGQTAVGVYTYYVVEVVNGCSGLPVQATLTITAVPITAAGADATICEGDTYVLSGTSTNNNGITWTTSGDGTFSDATIANPVYTPGVNDLANQTVVLTLTATGNNPCANVSDDMILTITPLATVDAGNDATICEGDTYVLSGTSTNNNGITWTTSGDGTFSDATIANPVYTPGVNDLANQTVVLTLTATGNNSCANVSDDMILTITPLATVDAGNDATICEGDTYVLSGTSTNNNGITWTTSGDGTFSDATIANPVYTPGVNDLANQTVVLTLTATGNNPCANVSDDMILTITPLATVDAGNDATICEGDTYVLSGTSTNNNGITWTTSGDGTFSDATIANPVYTPGVNDLANQTVVLTLTATGNNPCANVSDDMILTITPLATVDAGNDATICEGDTYVLSGTSTNNNGITWTTSGDGTFSDATIANPVYTPGVNDLANQTVVLTLTATGNNPCANVSDDMILTITPLATVDAGNDATICEEIPMS